MTRIALATIPPETSTDDDVETARIASQAVARLNGKTSVRVDAYADGAAHQTFVLPVKAVRLLTDILTYLGEGRSVAVMPTDARLTTQQCADMLNVSRPHFTKLLADGKLPFHMAGTHRRVRLQDLIAYRDQRDAGSKAARQSLVNEAQELGLGY